jgi:hypothetical protein
MLHHFFGGGVSSNTRYTSLVEMNTIYKSDIFLFLLHEKISKHDSLLFI